MDKAQINAEMYLKQAAPEMPEQIKYQDKLVKATKSELHNLEGISTSDPKYLEWLRNELRFQQAIYQTLCMAEWMVDLCTKDILSMPGNRPTETKHNQCWVPFFLNSDRRWTIVKVTRGVAAFEYHPLGDVATETEAIDWASNENFSQFNLEDEGIIADVLKGTVFEKEVHHG